MKKYKNTILIGAALIFVLAFVFWWGGDSPALRGWNVSNVPHTTEHTKTDALKSTPIDKSKNKSAKSDATEQQKKEELAAKAADDAPTNKSYSEEKGMIIESNGKDKYQTNPVPEGKPVPIEPQCVTITDEMHTCTLSVRCDTILKNISWLDPEKVEIVPKDGVILANKEVTFYEGESVFNLLKREMKKNKIHFEFVNTPIYNSAYIEGIANIYEFDCGELSGWLYKVNGWFPSYGSSRYQLKQGDKVEMVYSCDLGKDVGAYFASGGGQKDE